MLTDSQLESVDKVLSSHKNMPGALLPILHGIQDAVGYIPAEAVQGIANELNISRAEVHGVVTYYHHFRSEPAGQHVVQICKAESCRAMGSDRLWAHACLHLTSDGHGKSPDGSFTLEPVYCLGMCASSPSMTVDGKVHARVSVEKFNRLIETARTQP